MDKKGARPRTSKKDAQMVENSKESKTDIGISNTNQQLRGDWTSIILLTFLYVLQGIPIGLAASVPMILQNRNVTYKQQAVFSFVYWPFSLKLLWAPIVDSWYSSKMGRRKTWLVPTQYLLGLFMLLLSGIVDNLFGDQPQVLYLAMLFFILNFLAATQDIAVDGWALTMLSRRNVGYASTCNCVGQTGGYFLGNVVFLALESAEFCNNYIRSIPQTTGLVTLQSFLYFWGCIFIVSTTLVWIFKTEKVDNSDSDVGVSDTYITLWKIITKRHVLLFAAILLTAKIGFAATDAITGLKLIEAGVPKDKLALIAVPMIPVQMLLPLIISKYTAGPRPMNVYMKAIPYRLLFGLVAAALVWWTPIMHLGGGEFPTSYYVILLLFYACHQVTLYSMFVAGMAFHARISDVDLGGTYMTLLNTLANLGGVWPTTLVLTLVDFFTLKTCTEINDPNLCKGVKDCKLMMLSCETFLDGYFIITFSCVIFGVVWLWLCKSKVHYLQNLNLKMWR
uniref:Major facilitator superfamily (MFS) profile domain-containing protein n=1 Tax=Strigamia maritima TaxID=126957 RepID=T1IYX5_STRMM